MKVPLIALKDSRRLRVSKDALFLASRREARVLKAVGLAADAPPMGVAMPRPHSPPPVMDERAALRGIYRQTFGKLPFNGWDADTLREKINAAGGTYQTRRLKARD